MISALLIVCNEEHRLRACIASLRGAVAEVCVVVQESQDGTLALARELADRVSTDRCHLLSEPSRDLGLSLCSHEWVINLDADEELTAHGRLHLPHLCRMGAGDLYAVRHTVDVEGHRIEDALQGRAFRRSAVVGPKEIHTGWRLKSGAAAFPVEGPTFIASNKSWAEQRADDERYQRVAARGWVVQVPAAPPTMA